MRQQTIAERGLRRAGAAALLLAACGLTPRADGAIIDIAASTNAFVLRTTASANTDQSEAQTLVTKRLNDSNTRLAYVRFDLPAGLDEDDITSATLRLSFVNNSSIGTGITQDTVRVYGLLDSVSAEGSWLDTITWNTQPARSAAPDDIPNAGTALPNANTTAAFGTSSPYPINATVPPASVVETTLNVVAFQSFVAADTNDEVTLLFHNLNNVIVSWASLTNSNINGSTIIVPTLRLDLVPEPASALLACGGLLLRRRGRNRLQPHS